MKRGFAPAFMKKILSRLLHSLITSGEYDEIHVTPFKRSLRHYVEIRPRRTLTALERVCTGGMCETMLLNIAVIDCLWSRLSMVQICPGGLRMCKNVTKVSETYRIKIPRGSNRSH